MPKSQSINCVLSKLYSLKTISIAVFNLNNESAFEIELENAYPLSTTAIEMNHDPGEPITFTVSFAYDKWKYKEIII